MRRTGFILMTGPFLTRYTRNKKIRVYACENGIGMAAEAGTI